MHVCMRVCIYAHVSMYNIKIQVNICICIQIKDV